MKVYLVSTGEYSDYHIVGVFSTHEKAQEYIDINKAYAAARDSLNGVFVEGVRDDFNDIDEREVDKDLEICEHPVWIVRIALDTGNRIGGMDIQVEFSVPDSEVFLRDRCAEARSSDSEEHALKLAAEARQGWLRGKSIGA